MTTILSEIRGKPGMFWDTERKEKIETCDAMLVSGPDLTTKEKTP
ncbi:MAG: hypothetical protein ABIE42_05715 [Candidatus Eisenbacteria bacterium]